MSAVLKKMAKRKKKKLLRKCLNANFLKVTVWSVKSPSINYSLDFDSFSETQ